MSSSARRLTSIKTPFAVVAPAPANTWEQQTAFPRHKPFSNRLFVCMKEECDFWFCYGMEARLKHEKWVHSKWPMNGDYGDYEVRLLDEMERERGGLEECDPWSEKGEGEEKGVGVGGVIGVDGGGGAGVVGGAIGGASAGGGLDWDNLSWAELGWGTFQTGKGQKKKGKGKGGRTT